MPASNTKSPRASWIDRARCGRLAAALIVLTLWWFAALSGQGGPSSDANSQLTTQAGAQALPEEWYDDDEWHHQIRYINSPQEVMEYRALKTVGAREDFIARFWARRDPTPASARNEFREEFDRRVDYANNHFADPGDAPHTGVDTERGRIYVLFGAPTSVATFPKGAHALWRYAGVTTVGANVAIEFSVPPIDSCDGSYRIRSPAPAVSVKRGHTSVDVYRGGLVTARIATDFAQVASIAHSLRTARGEQVLEGDGAFWDGQMGPAGKDPLSRHILDCRMFESGGMGFTHPLPAGSYVFSSTVTFLDGVVRREAVPFQVK